MRWAHDERLRKPSRLPSPGTLGVLVAGLLLLTIPTGASFAWLNYLSARYRLFRWDRP
jgi:hypothetical protein